MGTMGKSCLLLIEFSRLTSLIPGKGQIQPTQRGIHRPEIRFIFSGYSMFGPRPIFSKRCLCCVAVGTASHFEISAMHSSSPPASGVRLDGIGSSSRPWHRRKTAASRLSLKGGPACSVSRPAISCRHNAARGYGPSKSQLGQWCSERGERKRERERALPSL